MMSWKLFGNLIKYRDLQIVCSQLKIKGVKNSMKEQMIKKLVSLYQIKANYDKILEMPDPALTRKYPQYPCRLLNILFSDAYAEGFSQLGNVAAFTELDAGKAANNQPTISHFLGRCLRSLWRTRRSIWQFEFCRWWGYKWVALHQLQENSASQL